MNLSKDKLKVLFISVLARWLIWIYVLCPLKCSTNILRIRPIGFQKNRRISGKRRQMALQLQLFMFMEALAANCQGKVLEVVGPVIGTSVWQ